MNFLKPTVFKTFFSLLVFILSVFALVAFISSNCARRECIPPEYGGACVIPSYCTGYDGIIFLAFTFIIPVVFYVVYSYIQKGRQSQFIIHNS